MSLSPLNGDDAYTECETPVIMRPQNEWSALLQQHVRVGPDRHVVYRAASTLPVRVVSPQELAAIDRGILVCSGIPLEVRIETCGRRAIFDFHEAWHDVHYGSPHTHWNVVVHHTAGHYTATRSCSARFDGTVVSVQIVRSRTLHGVYAYGADTLARVRAPANGQVWSTPLLPGVLLVALFCPRRGYVCPTCNHGFASLAMYHTHCTGASAVPEYQCVNANGRTFCKAREYPRPMKPLMSTYSICQFSPAKLVQLLSGVKRRRQLENRRHLSCLRNDSTKLQINPFH